MTRALPERCDAQPRRLVRCPNPLHPRRLQQCLPPEPCDLCPDTWRVTLSGLVPCTACTALGCNPGWRYTGGTPLNAAWLVPRGLHPDFPQLTCSWFADIGSIRVRAYENRFDGGSDCDVLVLDVVAPICLWVALYEGYLYVISHVRAPGGSYGDTFSGHRSMTCPDSGFSVDSLFTWNCGEMCGGYSHVQGSALLEAA